jgi:hypothetical protein
MPDVTFGGAFSFAARSLFARGPILQMIRVIAVAPLASDERIHRTIYGLDESHSLMETASRVRRRTNVLWEATGEDFTRVSKARS